MRHDLDRREAKLKRLAELKEKQYTEDLHWLLNSERGRRFFMSQQVRGGQYNTSFTGNSVTFFNEGKRDTALKLLEDLKPLGMIGLDMWLAAQRESYINANDLIFRVEQEFKGV